MTKQERITIKKSILKNTRIAKSGIYWHLSFCEIERYYQGIPLQEALKKHLRLVFNRTAVN